MKTGLSKFKFTLGQSFARFWLVAAVHCSLLLGQLRRVIFTAKESSLLWGSFHESLKVGAKEEGGRSHNSKQHVWVKGAGALAYIFFFNRGMDFFRSEVCCEPVWAAAAVKILGSAFVHIDKEAAMVFALESTIVALVIPITRSFVPKTHYWAAPIGFPAVVTERTFCLLCTINTCSSARSKAHK